MRRIVLIHTVKSVLESFEPMLREACEEELLIHNILDDFLASDPAVTGVFSDANKTRLANDVKNGELTGADIVVVTCSTLTPAVTELRPTAAVPLIAIDDAMCRLAVTYGPRVTMMATARSTVEPTRSKILAEARAAGVDIELETVLVEDALTALKRGDAERHDILLGEAATMISDRHVVVLAQASMARAQDRVAAACGRPVLVSPAACIEEIRLTLSRLEAAHTWGGRTHSGDAI